MVYETRDKLSNEIKLDASDEFNINWNICHPFLRVILSLVMNLFWTSDGAPHRASLHFSGVSTFQLSAEKIFRSDIVELISIEARPSDGGFEINGELSNYCFSILCDRMEEEIRE